MITFRKLTANGAGKLIVAYLREHQLEPENDVRTDRDLDKNTENGERLNSYYTGREGKGAWAPNIGAHIADALGIDTTKPPTDEALARLFEATRADTGVAWKNTGRKREISGFDFTASPDKSVTLAAEFAATKAEQALIWQAIHLANDRALRLIGSEIGLARRGSGDKAFEEEGEVAWVSFRHYTARPALHIQDGEAGATASVEIPVPGDPQAHIHNVMLNAVATESGHVGSLDSARLTKVTAHLYGAYFQAELAQELRKLGVQVAPDARGKAVVIEAIPREACEAFSKRSRQAEQQAKAFVKRQGGDWNTMTADQKFQVLHQANLAYRSKKYDGTNDREIWREQAREMGWEHKTVLTDEKPRELSEQERFEKAYEVAAKLLADEFRTAAVLDKNMFRVHAAHGLIASGIASCADIDRVAEMIEERGIMMNGEMVLFVEKERDRLVQIATTAQVALEEEMAELAGLASRTQTGVLPSEQIAAAIARSGLDFEREPDHGKAQLAAIYAMGEAGQLAFLTGVAGAGKTTLLQPLVDAWKHDGRRMVGAALAWRQADALSDAGIEERHALAPLLRKIEDGSLSLDSGSVLVLDEGSQIAPGQMLQILRYQREAGFALRILADREQAQAIEAGDAVELLMRVLPKEAQPALLSTVRQKTVRGREIAGLFRSPGRDLTLSEAKQKEQDTQRARQAIDMKRKDGTFSLVGGDHTQVVENIADFYLKRRDMLTAAGSKRGITMSAPTNEDVMALSIAVRERLRVRGEIGKEEIVRAAIDQREEEYDLPLSVGDRVRLFSRTNCLTRSNDRSRWCQLGNNGDFVDVKGWNDNGIVLRNGKGVEGFVPWERLADQKTGRIKLGFGHAMTIDAAQGITSDEHINAMPRGTTAITGFTAYVAESRHVLTSWTKIAEAPVTEAETFARPLGDKTPVTIEDILNRIAGDMGRHPYKALAIDLEGVELKYQNDLRRWITQAHVNEKARQEGKSPGEKQRVRQASRGLRTITPEQWDDVSRKLRRQAYQTQNVAEAIKKSVDGLKHDQQAMRARPQEQSRDRGRSRNAEPDL
jgi:energy-coupling factor transporter ATP-binding protein EcfA2